MLVPLARCGLDLAVMIVVQALPPKWQGVQHVDCLASCAHQVTATLHRTLLAAMVHARPVPWARFGVGLAALIVPQAEPRLQWGA